MGLPWQKHKYKNLGWRSVLQPWTAIPGVNQEVQDHPWMEYVPAAVTAATVLGPPAIGALGAIGGGGTATGSGTAAAGSGAASGGGFSWTGALKSAGKYGAMQGVERMMQPKQEEPLMPPTPIQMPAPGPMGPEGEALRQQQLARLRAYFMAAQGGGNGPAY
jgi:hypothetical protein